jgi:sulfate transport system ATP-binding protein
VRHELRRWLRRLHTELHFTSVFVTHDQQEAIEVADSIVVLNRGRIEQGGAPGEVYDRPQSAYVHRFLGQVNELPVRWQDGRPHVGPVDVTDDRQRIAGGGAYIALVRPHDVELGGAAGWAATIRDVRVIGPIVRLELCLEGRPAGEPLEAEISRERFEADRFQAGQTVVVGFRRWQLYPAAGRLSGDAAAV